MSLGASGSGSVDAGTPQRFLRGDVGDPAAAARSDLFPTWEGFPRTEPEGPVSASQGSTFHWHRGSSITPCRLAEDFDATAQMSEAESCPDGRLGNLTGAPGLREGGATSIEESELVPGTMVLWSPANSEGAGTRLVVVTALAFRERESNASSPWWDFLSIYDGETEHALPLELLPTLKPVPLEVPRALMPALASTLESPPPLLLPLQIGLGSPLWRELTMLRDLSFLFDRKPFLILLALRAGPLGPFKTNLG